ncbi:MAG: ABC transporter ATP-binding protein [Neomegalonema sp.]|nr:ABC transporter ATP-binding protein [Neomegalonema sp.]
MAKQAADDQKRSAAQGPSAAAHHNAHPLTNGAHLAIFGLSHAYRKADGKVLKDVSLEVQPGEIVALIGRSGSGKSTLLHMMAGLLQPSAGEVVIDGDRVRKPSPRWVMMFQAPSLYPWMTVAQNAALGLRFTRRGREAQTRVPEVLELVELSEFADRNVQDLSGGQQQRVALARSLAPRPDLLLLDEPFSALDVFTRRALQRDVRAIAQQLGLTLVLVTHDVSEAALMADRAIVLASGPGRIAGEVDLRNQDQAQEGVRDVNSADFKRAQTRLTDLYAKVVGADAASFSGHQDDSSEKETV